MNINGKQRDDLTFDLMDSVDMERIRNALEQLKSTARKETDLVELTQGPSIILEEIAKARRFTDLIFGDGTFDELIDSKTNFREAANVLTDIVDEIHRQKEELDITLYPSDKYSPNRAQRRAKNKGKR